MPKFRAILILLFAALMQYTLIARGQKRDTKAELEIHGLISAINISPNGHIWLVTAMGNMYYTTSIDSPWHYGHLSHENQGQGGFGPFFKQMSFFNNDTAIVTGLFASSDEENSRGGYLLTEDEGKSWGIGEYGGDSWIYDAFVNEHGKAWLGSLSKELFYSADFGYTWRTIKMEYLKADRTYSIYMQNDSVGIAGSDAGEILATKDNWEHFIHIQNPPDTRTYTSNQPPAIRKVRLWKNYIIVKSDERIFYSSFDSIYWQSFPGKILDFDIDAKTQKLLAISENFNVLSFSEPNISTTITKKPLDVAPNFIKVTNGKLYGINWKYDIYEVSETSCKKTRAYTYDRNISGVNNITKGRRLTWGSIGDQLYLSTDHGKSWYRENSLNFNIRNITLISDHEAILWDGEKENFRYSTTNHSCTKYTYKNPISDFLTAPVSAIKIEAFLAIEGERLDELIYYTRQQDSSLKSTDFIVDNGVTKTIPFEKQISSADLRIVLNAINSNPDFIPAASNQNITKEDKEEYKKHIHEYTKGAPFGFGDAPWFVSDTNFYLDFLPYLDTVSSATILSVLDQQLCTDCGSMSGFKIQFTNQKRESLIISKRQYEHRLPGCLSWTIQYNDKHFVSYDNHLSDLINSCLPTEFSIKDEFNKSNTIIEIAHYLQLMNQQKE